MDLTELTELLERPFKSQEIVLLTLRIAEQLKEVHDADLIHKNICPDNILFEEEDFCLQEDLGAEDSEESSSEEFEPEYPAPENEDLDKSKVAYYIYVNNFL